MSPLERRDRRRARALVRKINSLAMPTVPGFVAIIAAAMKREREETGFGAVKALLFTDSAGRSKTRRQIAQAYCTRKHCSGRNCSKTRKAVR